MKKMLRVILALMMSMALMDISSIDSAIGEEFPYNTRGVGVYSPLNGDFSGSGTGTPIVQHTFNGSVVVTPTANPLVFDFAILPENPQETIATNGDKIYFSGSGQVDLIPLDPMLTTFSAVWSGDYVVEGGTGQFAPIAPGSAPLVVIAINDPFTVTDSQWTFRWRLHGFIDLPVAVQPFRIRGQGIAPEGLPLPGQDPRPHLIAGQANHLGVHTGQGTVRTDTAVPQPNGTITGEFGSGDPFIFTDANGDQMVTYYGRTDFGASQPGTFTLTVLEVLPGGELVVEAEWIAEFVVQPNESTGRFAGTTGSWIMIANSCPFVLGTSDPACYSWQGQGFLTFLE